MIAAAALGGLFWFVEGRKKPAVKAIMKEFDDFRKQPGWKGLFKPNQDNDLVLGNDGQTWTELLLFDRGSWDPRYCAIFKTTCKIFGGLRDVEGIFNGKRSGQVSLLKLDAESRQFQQGEVLVLDDSFLHSVKHGGIGPRVTLFASFFHPKAKPFSPEEWYARSEA